MSGLIGRVACSVPGCGRTRARNEYPEWVCGDHWAAVPRADRNEYTLIKRRWRRGEAVDPAEVWARCKAKAIEAAFGI